MSTYAAPCHIVQQRPLPAAISQIVKHPSTLIVRHPERDNASDAQELQFFTSSVFNSAVKLDLITLKDISKKLYSSNCKRLKR